MATKIERTNETKNFVISAKVTGVDLVPEDNTRLRLAFDTTFETYNMSTGVAGNKHVQQEDYGFTSATCCVASTTSTLVARNVHGAQP